MTRALAAFGIASALAFACAGAARAGVKDSGPFAELTFGLGAEGASSGVETRLSPWPGARGGYLFALGERIRVGGDLGLSFTADREGTSRVAVTRALLGLEARLLVAAGYGGRSARLLPYAFAGPFLSAGAGLFEADGESTSRLLLSPGLRAGGGLLFRFRIVQLRIELGGGVRNGRPEVVGGLSLGAAL